MRLFTSELCTPLCEKEQMNKQRKMFLILEVISPGSAYEKESCDRLLLSWRKWECLSRETRQAVVFVPRKEQFLPQSRFQPWLLGRAWGARSSGSCLLRECLQESSRIAASFGPPRRLLPDSCSCPTILCRGTSLTRWVQRGNLTVSLHVAPP